MAKIEPKKNRDGCDVLSHIFTFGLFATSLAAVIFAGLLWYETRDLVIHTQRLADDAAADARLNLRAYVTAELADPIPQDGLPVTAIRLRFRNGGQTPAYRLAYNVRVFQERRNVGESWTWQFPERDLLENRIGVLADTAAIPVRTDYPINFGNIGESSLSFFVVGVIYYFDIYNIPHWTSFCFVWSENNITPDSATYCNAYNETDETLPQHPRTGPLINFPVSR